jgi:DNA-binding beta-propeller fold protein YncE
MAVDLASHAVTEKLAPADHAHAVLPIPGASALLETDGKSDSVRLIDAKTGAVRWALKTGVKPDAALWDPFGKRAIVMHNGGGTIVLVDVANARLAGEITVKPGLEMAAIDKRGLLWVNNEDTNMVTPVNLTTLTAGEPVPLPKCVGATGLAYAPQPDALIAACGNGIAFVVDASAHKVIAHFAIGKHADSAIADIKRGIVAIPCGEGSLEFVDISGARVRHMAPLKTEAGARTGDIDPRTGVIYLPTARFAAPEKAGGRPKMIPGSFHILVVAPVGNP